MHKTLPLQASAPGATPLYLRLKEQILAHCQGMQYFSPLPGERELCAMFGVSRPTVRKVLDILEKENAIMRVRGKGSFFLGNKIHVDSQGSAQGIAFYNEVVSSGKYTRSKVLAQNVEMPPPEIAALLNIKETDRVFHLERLRYIGDKLYSLANAYVPCKTCPELLREDFRDQSLYATLEKYGIYPYRMRKVLEIKPADHYEAMHLEVQGGDPVSIMSTVTYDKDNRIVECAISKSLAYNTRYEMMSYKDNLEE